MRVIAVLHRVFSQTQYSVVAGGVVLLAISAALLLPHWQIIAQIGSSGSVGLWSKLSFLVSLYGTIGTSFTIFSGSILILSVVLFGINIALLIFYIRRRQSTSNAGGTASLVSLGGAVSAVLGIGCAACGSVILTAVLGLLGAGGLLVLLPFHGVEFGVLGVVLLLVSCWYLIKKIDDPLVCSVK
jgi:hypothetical protein